MSVDLNMRNFAKVVAEYEAAPWGHRQEVLASRLPLMQMSEGTFHRRRQKLFGGNGRKAPTTKEGQPLRGQRKNPEYVDAVKEIIKLKYSKTRGVRPLTTEDAMVEAANAGVELALDIPPGTVNRIARELQLHPRVARKENRFEAGRANEMHQLDASRSEYFQCWRLVGNEWVLKLSPTIFKNREYQEHRMRVWIWGLVDDFSGYRVMRYCVDKGENALAGIDFLQWAWSRSEEHAPFRGLPATLYLDKGPLDKTKAFQHFCNEVAGVRILSHDAGRPQATGKVEAGWKDLWRRFEARFFRQTGWERREFSLAELNQELFWYLKEQHNQQDHRRLKISKEAAWLTVQGVVDIDPAAWRHIFHREWRTLDAGGCFDFRGAAYQVRKMPYPGDVRAEIYLGVRDGAMLVVDPRDGKKYLAQPFAPHLAGEFHSGAETPLERLQKEEQPVVPRVTFEPQGADNLRHLVRQEEVRLAPEVEALALPAPAPPPTSLEELALGVEVLAPPEEGEKLFATVHARQDWLMEKVIRGEVLTPEEREFMAWYAEEYREILAVLAQDEARAQLALVGDKG